MAGENIYSFSDPLNSGIDFYEADAADVNIVISISSSLTVTSYKTAFSNIAIAANSSAVINATKIAYASANLSVDGATVTVATERQDALVTVSANTSLTASSLKIAYGSVSTTRTNLITNPNFETNLTNWVGGGSAAASIARTTSQAYLGTASLQATATVTGNSRVYFAPAGWIPVTAGLNYTFYGYTKAATVARPTDVLIEWINSSGVVISTPETAEVNNSTAGWTQTTVLTATAPVDAVYAQPSVRFIGAVVGEIHYLDAVMFEQSSTTLPYFDGTYDTSYSGYTLISKSWSGTADASTSTATWTTTSASANLTAVSTKIAHASSAISITSNVSASALKISRGASQILATSSLTASVIRFKFASAILSGSVNLSTFGKIVLATIRINLLQNANVSAKFVKFSSVTGVDSSSIRTLLLLDGKPLTNQNRTLNISSMPVFIENRNWAGNSSRYYKNQTSADKKSFNINWTFIPNFRENTVDERHSRDYIRKLSLDPDIHELRIINQDSDGITPYTETVYNVFIKDFSENLIRRDMVDNVYYFDCSISLEEA